MKVVVENLTGTLFYVQVGNKATVADLKREIESPTEAPLRPHLIKDDVDGVLLVDYGVQDGSHVYMFVNPLDDGSTDHPFELNWFDSVLG
ncbi:hypothetical protein L3X38_012732 [Prunus dulcis]|uniref:Ubiquitin-like domain-containing protein n=1 Tax=Prunus dulcis TaxID=3755 RepID=A0AAD4WJW2_PRUDU|nr:hypothetical protein L3X38_012732 [Prunus dulcis]